MSRSNLPPGTTTRDINEAFGEDRPCDICGQDCYDCQCPECHVCGTVGDPNCYVHHKGGVLALNTLVGVRHFESKRAGWHDQPREKGTMLMLIVSEVAEAMEGERKGLMDDHLPERPMAEVELADAIIRICDYAGAYGYDLGGAVADKLAYNRNREDHKREVRKSQGGKKF